MQKYNILWADDEIDLLKPHILFLTDKGYEVTPVNNGAEAIDLCEKHNYDIVFLDENMPGMSGLETLNYIKSSRPNIPVVMITKSEEETIMEEAIGSKIADYLIKPLNPNQILLSVKKILDNKRLISEKINSNYQQEFRNLSIEMDEFLDHETWATLYKKLIYWDLEINETENKSMSYVLENQLEEANSNFSKFIINSYESWLNDPESDNPLLSHQLMKKVVLPQLDNDVPVFFILIDNLRFDQWKVIEPILKEYYHIDSEESYYSILPTTTAYARNAIFSGMLPLEMSKQHQDLWVGEDSEEGKNNNEEKFLERQLKKIRPDTKFSYHKILHTAAGKSITDNIHNLMNNELNVIVYNFVDMLSHARTDMKMIRELAPDEPAYRSITKSWFIHSPLIETLKKLSSLKAKVIITTDHGTVRVKKALKVKGDRNTNTNLRFKVGKNLDFEQDNSIFTIKDPEKLHLPKPNISSRYLFASKDRFFAYPNNFNHYVKYYMDTFQHGGISLEEMIIPIISLSSKNG